MTAGRALQTRNQQRAEDAYTFGHAPITTHPEIAKSPVVFESLTYRSKLYGAEFVQYSMEFILIKGSRDVPPCVASFG